MPPVAVEIRNDVQSALPVSDVEALVQRLLDRLPEDREWRVTIRFVADRPMRALNKKYLGRDYPTDVLSFPTYDFQEGRPPALPSGPLLLGEVVVNLDEAQRISTASGPSLLREVQSKIAHGVQHLIGYHHNDEIQGREAWQKETS